MFSERGVGGNFLVNDLKQPSLGNEKNDVFSNQNSSHFDDGRIRERIVLAVLRDTDDRGSKTDLNKLSDLADV